MSFILDALKKSEAERQRKSVPGFADIPDGRNRPPTNRWWWLAGTVVTLNLALALGMFLWQSRERPETTLPPQPEAAAAPATVPSLPAFSDLVAEARRQQSDPELPLTTEPQRSETPPARPPARSAVAVSEPLSTLNELRADGRLQLPELHLDIHVYSEKPAERFVFINMNRYRERTTLNEGPQVREITPDGVLLEHQGTRFMLPRQ